MRMSGASTHLPLPMLTLSPPLPTTNSTVVSQRNGTYNPTMFPNRQLETILNWRQNNTFSACLN